MRHLLIPLRRSHRLSKLYNAQSRYGIRLYWWLGLALALMMVVTSAGVVLASPPTYSITDLGYYGTAWGVNNAAEVVGQSFGAGSAVSWSNGSTDTFVPGGSAFGINNANPVQIVGGLSGGNNGGFILTNGSISPVGPTATGAAYAINGFGQIAGDTSTDNNTAGYAWLDTNNSYVNLSVFAGGNSTYAVPGGINSSGAVIGNEITPGSFQGFFYSNGILTTLGSLPGDTASEATGVNNAGQVVGGSGTFNGVDPGLGVQNLHAFAYTGGIMSPLGSLPGVPYSQANAIDNSGDIIGDTYYAMAVLSAIHFSTAAA